MLNLKSSYKEKGVSFLEIIVVVGILGVTTFFVMPKLNNWRANAMVEKDFNAMVSQIEYIKSRTTVLNGTGFLVCSSNNSLTYQISSNRQTNYSFVDPQSISNLLEDSSSSNTLSGKTNLISPICANKKGVFLSNGFSGVESGGLIDIEINYLNDKINYPAYRVTIGQSTSFIQKYLWNSTINAWIELE